MMTTFAVSIAVLYEVQIKKCRNGAGPLRRADCIADRPRGKVYCASVMGSSIFLSAAQVKNREASARMGQEFPEKTGIPLPCRWPPTWG